MRLIFRYCLFLLFFTVSKGLVAQYNSNPFELNYRRDSISVSANKYPSSSQFLNPFDVVDQIIVRDEHPRREIEEEPTDETNSDFLFWVFLFLLLFFTTVISLSRKRLEQIYKAFINDNFLRKVYRSNQVSISLSHLLLYLFFFFNLGLFLFLLLPHLDISLPPTFTYLIYMVLGVIAVFLIKHLILWIVGSIFPIHKEIGLYAFTIIVFSILLGIVLLPINILVAFAPISIAQLAIYGGLGAILATYGFRSLRGVSIGSKYFLSHSFHFLLYLCAVEILPVIILTKILLLNFS